MADLFAYLAAVFLAMLVACFDLAGCGLADG